MLVGMLLASSLIAAPPGTQQIAKAADACPSAEIMMGAHKTAPAEPHRAAPEGLLPTPQPESRGPAVLLPECKAEPVKRRKRKSDYPMA